MRSDWSPTWSKQGSIVASWSNTLYCDLVTSASILGSMPDGSCLRDFIFFSQTPFRWKSTVPFPWESTLPFRWNQRYHSDGNQRYHSYGNQREADSQCPSRVRYTFLFVFVFAKHIGVGHFIYIPSVCIHPLQKKNFFFLHSYSFFSCGFFFFFLHVSFITVSHVYDTH